MFTKIQTDTRRIAVTHNIGQRFLCDRQKTVFHIAWNRRRHIIGKSNLILISKFIGHLTKRLLEIQRLIVQIMHALANVIHRLRKRIIDSNELPVQRLLFMDCLQSPHLQNTP